MTPLHLRLVVGPDHRHLARSQVGEVRVRILLVDGQPEVDDREQEQQHERQHECELDDRLPVLARDLL